MNKQILSIFSLFIFTAQCSQVENKIVAENPQGLNYANFQQIRDIFDEYKINPTLQNTTLSYLKKCEHDDSVDQYSDTFNNNFLSYLLKINNLPSVYWLSDYEIACVKNNKIHIENIITKDSKTLTEEHADKIISIAHLSQGCLISGDTHSIKFWNLDTEKCERVIEIGSPVHCILPLPDGYLAIGSENKVKFLNMTTGECERTFEMESSIDSLALSEDGNIIVCIYVVNKKLATIKCSFDLKEKVWQEQACQETQDKKSRKQCYDCVIQ